MLYVNYISIKLEGKRKKKNKQKNPGKKNMIVLTVNEKIVGEFSASLRFWFAKLTTVSTASDKIYFKTFFYEDVGKGLFLQR